MLFLMEIGRTQNVEHARKAIYARIRNRNIPIDLQLHYTPASNLGYLAPSRTISHGCQLINLYLLNVKRSCPPKLDAGGIFQGYPP